MATNNNRSDLGSVTGKVFNILNEVKGFEVGIIDPRSGKLIIRYNDIVYQVSFDHAYTTHPEGMAKNLLDFDDIIQDQRWFLKEK